MTLISMEHFLHTLSNGGKAAFQLGLVSFIAEYALGVTQKLLVVTFQCKPRWGSLAESL